MMSRDYTTIIIQILTTPESLEQYKPIQYKTRPTTPAVNMEARAKRALLPL